jgi:hypothetical protein
MKNFTHKFRLIGMAALAILLFQACSKDDGPSIINPPGGTEFSTGWNAEQEKTDSIPRDISFSFGNQNLPSAYDLTDKFPPVGDQGQYGTCVAWAVGYSGKTAINAIDNNWGQADLANPSNQTSALDLFLNIPQQQRSPNCDGTTFEPAMKVLADRGVASKQVAPYVNVGNCTQPPDPSWASNAGQNKISNFRQVERDVTTLKRNIADNRPVVFGARLGDNFMEWRSEEVLSGHTSFNNVGLHARHAMTIVGYDDSRGPRGAFKVVNSWGHVWGSDGFIWIDYQFMVDPDFGFIFFVMQNDAQDIDPENHQSVTGVDLIPWDLADIVDWNSGNPRQRFLIHDIYNIGSQTLPASNSWDYIYAYVNPFNADDWGVILHNEVTSNYGQLGQIGDHPSGLSDQSVWSHANIPSNSSLGNELFGDLLSWNYTMPSLTGYYYLVMVVDPNRKVNEPNRQNNFYWIGNDYGFPIYFVNGVQHGLRPGAENELTAPDHIATAPKAEFVSEPRKMNSRQWNAYTNDEIDKLVKGSIDFNLISRHMSKNIAENISGKTRTETE